MESKNNTETKGKEKGVSITLTLPIKIRRTVNNDGYVIIDANEIEHFFYEEDKLLYDGFCAPVKEWKPKKPKTKSAKSAKKNVEKK